MSEWVCGNCKSINRAAASSCYSCGGSKSAVAAPDPQSASTPATDFRASPMATTTPAAASAAVAGAPFGGPTLAAPMAEMAPPTPASMSDVLGGLLAGGVAAIVATAIWYGVVAATQYQLGIVAIAVGFLVGQGVVLGARRRSSVALVVISVVLTLVALAISEYLIVAYFVGQEFGVPVDIVQPPDFVVSVITDSLAADPITLAFWAIALFQAVAIPWRAITKWTPVTDAPAVNDRATPNEAPAA